METGKEGFRKSCHKSRGVQGGEGRGRTVYRFQSGRGKKYNNINCSFILQDQRPKT